MKQIILVILVLTGININAQNFDKYKMDSLFTLIETNQKGMGSLSIFQNGEEVYQNSFGFASIEENIKASHKTKYRIGSISKTYTATIIMQLIEEGKLDLSSKLSQYYPEVKNSERITIAYLLKHRSGIFNFTNSEDDQSWMKQQISKEKLVTKLVDYGSSFEPNEKAEYSNANYVFLSFIAEKIENKNFSEILKERICVPCSLKRTYYGSKISVKNNEALSYTKLNDWEIAAETDMSVSVGAGAIVSNSTDINNFLNCLFSYKVVSKKTLEIMMEIQDGYGIGMFQVPFYDKKAFGHTGGIDGFQSNAFYFPEEKVSVAYTSNGVVMPTNDILIGALSIYFGNYYTMPEFKEALQLKSEDLDKYLGIYSSPTFPLKITISKKENVLIAQATGQPSFPLEAYEKDKFKFDQAMLKMEFIPNEEKMILRQRGGEYELIKE